MKTYHYELALVNEDKNDGVSSIEPIYPIIPIGLNPEYEKQITQVISDNKFKINSFDGGIKIEYIDESRKTLSSFIVADSEFSALIKIMLQFNLEFIHNQEKLKK